MIELGLTTARLCSPIRASPHIWNLLPRRAILHFLSQPPRCLQSTAFNGLALPNPDPLGNIPTVSYPSSLHCGWPCKPSALIRSQGRFFLRASAPKLPRCLLTHCGFTYLGIVSTIQYQHVIKGISETHQVKQAPPYLHLQTRIVLVSY